MQNPNSVFGHLPQSGEIEHSNESEVDMKEEHEGKTVIVEKSGGGVLGVLGGLGGILGLALVVLLIILVVQGCTRTGYGIGFGGFHSPVLAHDGFYGHPSGCGCHTCRPAVKVVNEPDFRHEFYILGDKLAQVNAERYADHVGWKILDKSEAYTNRELGQYAAFQSALGHKDELINKLRDDAVRCYATNLFEQCVKEEKNLITPRHIVAPIGPYKAYPVDCDRDRDRDRRDFDPRPYAAPPVSYGYDKAAQGYTPFGFPGGLPLTSPVVTTPATVPVTVYPQPLVTQVAP